MKKIKNVKFVSVLIVFILVLISGIFYFNYNKNNEILSKSDFPVLYSKDNSLYMMKNNFKTEKIADNIYSSKPESFSSVSEGSTITDDGKTVFYKGNILENGTGTLYKLDVKKNESTEIAKNVYDFDIYKSSGNISYIVFESDQTFTLYCYDGNKSFEISKGLDSNSVFFIANSGQNVVYKKQNMEKGSFYSTAINSNENQICLSENVAGYSYNKKGDKVYYVDVKSDETGDKYILYMYDFVNSPQIIDEGVSPYIKVAGDDETLYYYKNVGLTLKASDYVIDDLAEQDKNIAVPDPLAFSGKTLEEYMTAEAAYKSKEVRDSIRQFIGTTEISVPSNTLYSYNNGEKKVIAENVFESYGIDSKNSFIIYSILDISKLPKINISQIGLPSDITNILSQSIQSSSKDVYICKSGKNPSKIEGYSNINLLTTKISAGSDKIMFFDNYTESTGGKLVIASVNENGNISGYFEPLKDTLVKTSIFDDLTGNTAFSYTDASGKNILEFTDGKTSEKVVENPSAYCFGTDNGILYYIEETDNESGAGNLCYIENGTVYTIDKDVYFMFYIGEGKMLYMNTKGSMFVFENGKSKQIDTGVESLFIYE